MRFAKEKGNTKPLIQIEKKKSGIIIRKLLNTTNTGEEARQKFDLA